MINVANDDDVDGDQHTNRVTICWCKPMGAAGGDASTVGVFMPTKAAAPTQQ
jgi:hypothetical protein